MTMYMIIFMKLRHKNTFLFNKICFLLPRLSTNSSNNMNNFPVNTNTMSASSGTALNKLNLNNIYTVEPLRIKLHENDEPRPPTLEESEIFISKLYDLYKNQKQQVCYLNKLNKKFYYIFYLIFMK